MWRRTAYVLVATVLCSGIWECALAASGRGEETADSRTENSGAGQPGTGEAGPGAGQPSIGEAGSGEEQAGAGEAGPGAGQPSIGEAGSGEEQPGASEAGPGAGQPGAGEPGPGTGQPEIGAERPEGELPEIGAERPEGGLPDTGTGTEAPDGGTEKPDEDMSIEDGDKAPGEQPGSQPGAGDPLKDPGQRQENALEAGNIVYSVSFPADTKAYLDPGNISGNGQIFSQEYSVENYGNTDVAIQINRIEIGYRSSEDSYEMWDSEVTDHQSETKKMNVDMIWKDAEGNVEKLLHIADGEPKEIVLNLEAAEYDGDGNLAGLRDGSVGTFCFAGTLNANPEIVWEDGEIVISFAYEICAIPAEEDAEGVWQGGMADAGVVF